MLIYLAVALFVCSTAAADFKPRAAIVHLSQGNIQGNVTFRQINADEIEVEGTIIGMPPGKYGFHVHEKGDLSGGCATAGAHFNPYSKNHGAPDAADRHVGDLGNVVFGDDLTAHIKFTDKLLALYGERNIIGRAVVLHDGTDDLGLGQQADSLTTGHAGGRAACGVIGILDPLEPWNGASATGASVVTILAFTFLALVISH